MSQEHQSYAMLKGDFPVLCKLIDGDVDQISEHKRKFVKGFGTTTAKLNVSPNLSGVSGEYAS
eukprot:372199-Ditylum_brightwellii.AAC.1